MILSCGGEGSRYFGSGAACVGLNNHKRISGSNYTLGVLEDVRLKYHDRNNYFKWPKSY